jgi:RND family efflux transporter MFP subunit
MTHKRTRPDEENSNGSANSSVSRGRLGLVLRIVGAVAIVVLVIAWQANVFTNKIDPGAVDREHPDATGRELARVESTPLGRTRELLGSLRARNQIRLAPRVSGRVLQINAEAGDRVAQDQIVVQLERGALEAALGEADAAVAIAEADLRGAEEALERVDAGFQNNVATEVRLIEATRQRDAAVAALRRAKAARAKAASQLDDATLRSPIDGIVIDTMVDAGDLAMPGQAVVAMFDPDRLEAQVSVPASLTGRFKEDATFPVIVEALDAETVATVRTLVQRSDPRTRSSLARLRITEVDGALPGMFVRLFIETGSRDALIIPRSAIGRVRQLTFVWRATDDDVLRRRLVRIGSELPDGRVEVLSGLERGDRILARWTDDPSDDSTGQSAKNRAKGSDGT